MGIVVNGKWYDQWDNGADKEGRMIPGGSQFRNWITADGSAGPSGEGGYQAEANRYHLYVAYICPFAHRALIMRKLKGLEDLISISVVSPIREDMGWTFAPGDGVDVDPVLGADYLSQIYTNVASNYSGTVTVPTLYDLKQNKIVNNESSEIMRMFNTAFDGVGAKEGDYYPEALRDEIDQLNDELFGAIAAKIYKAGSSDDPEGAKEAVTALYQELDKLEERFESNRYLLGDQLTEADWRLFVTLVRFDPVHHVHFSDQKKLADFKNINRYTQELYNYQGISETMNFDHMKLN